MMAFCFIILGVALLGGLLVSFGFGLQAFVRSRGQQDEYAQTLQYLGVNLCEPLINVVLVSLIFSSMAQRLPEWTPLATLPMVVLLLPAGGRRFGNLLYRSICSHLLWLGVGRWALNLAIYLCYSTFQHAGWLILLLVPIALGVFIYSVYWGHLQLNWSLFQPPSQPASQPLWVTLAAQPASASTAAAALIAPPRPPLDPDRALRCAICHALTTLDDESCAACGLVFRSRVPDVLQRLPDYQVLRPLSDGGMSNVYLARWSADAQLYVLKTVASVDASANRDDWYDEARACLHHEAGLLSQLSHPQIVRLHDYFTDQHGTFLTLHYAAGPTLDQRMAWAGAPLATETVLQYGASVAATLCYLAYLPQPLAHCDIKPANLVLPPGQQQPVLIDFGSAMPITDAATRPLLPSHYGTPGYAAPEQYRSVCTPTSDVYGLAATLYHALTGDDPTVHPLSFPALTRLPPAIGAALGPALRHDPADRPEVAAFYQSLRRLSEEHRAVEALPGLA